MGSQNSKFLSQQELPHEFRPLKQLPGVYESVLNGTRLQKHKIELNSEAEINYEKQIFVFRRMHADRVISAHFFQKFMPTHFCNMSYQVCFFTQYPSYALSLDLAFPMERGFQLLIQSLKGFQILHSKFGPFNLSFNNIFFDSHHQPKVWISSDLGKTKVETTKKQHASEQKMITGTFKLYDQIKDERNSRITFSNYLRKIKQKEFNTLTFKNVITYMVDQASRYFVGRTKTRECFNVQKTNREAVNTGNKNYNKNLEVKKTNKENHSNIISLRTRNRNDSNTPSTTAAMTSYQTTFNQSGKFSELGKEMSGQKNKKSKRHNSQEDYPHNREINFHRENHLPCTDEGFWIRHEQQAVHEDKHRHHPLEMGTIRVFRRSLDEVDRPIRIPPPQVHQNITRRTHLRRFNQQNHEPNHRFYNVLQTQIVNEDKKPLPQGNFHQIKINPQQNQRRHVAFQDRPHVIQMPKRVSTKEDFQQKEGESPLMLSNLHTIKSIINSDYSDLDSQIRNDLQNMQI